MIIKTGNPFSMLVIMRDSETREAIEITSDMEISSTIVNSSRQVIAQCEVAVCDQSTIKGGFILGVNQEITADWKVGVAKGDIRVKIGDVDKNSVNYSFLIEESITR
ncbi:hypothetical protein WCE00_12735 [Acinetobacter haemolyticus]|uniref:hypothetical protein n=1 Tax=Acinetobacter haemolyticus TaxID=29430 RepID=UPI0020661D59|nr:MAG TPA: hypothetical protein [Caudoviricetes sp.]